MTFYISLIAEGHTEVDCVPPLLYRIWDDILVSPYRLQVLPVSRTSRSAVIQTDAKVFGNKLEEARLKLVRYLGRDASSHGCIILLLDAEGECPATLGPHLASAMAECVPAELSNFCALAKRMFENWIVAGAKTLGGVNGLPNELPSFQDVENLNGANWLDNSLRGVNKARKYKKTEDAKEFVRAIDLTECCGNSPSFNRLVRKLRMLAETKPEPPDLPE